MNWTVAFSSTAVLGLLSATVLVGCVPEEASGKKDSVPGEQKKVDAKKVPIGKNVFLEIQGEQRRVLIQAYVCQRQGPLELLLTRKRTKEHEAVLAAEIDARDVHTALNLARAKEGRPVQFRPKFVAPSGTTIKITVEYEEKGKKVRLPAQQWVRDVKTKKDLEHDWVFAGSLLIEDPLEPKKKPFYAANDGDVICVSNFHDAMLDLPIDSSKDNAELFFEAHTDRIPAMETPVLVILEPVLPKKGKK